MTIDHTDPDRLQLLDRIEERLPDLKIDQRELEWRTLPDGAEALFVNSGGIDGGNGYFIANAGDDLHVIGTMAPMFPGRIGCVAIHDDSTRELVQVMPDPLAPPSD